jgi:hypothetical protein
MERSDSDHMSMNDYEKCDSGIFHRIVRVRVSIYVPSKTNQDLKGQRLVIEGNVILFISHVRKRGEGDQIG